MGACTTGVVQNDEPGPNIHTHKRKQEVILSEHAVSEAPPHNPCFSLRDNPAAVCVTVRFQGQHETARLSGLLQVPCPALMCPCVKMTHKGHRFQSSACHSQCQTLCSRWQLSFKARQIHTSFFGCTWKPALAYQGTLFHIQWQPLT